MSIMVLSHANKYAGCPSMMIFYTHCLSGVHAVIYQRKKGDINDPPIFDTDGFLHYNGNYYISTDFMTDNSKVLKTKIYYDEYRNNWVISEGQMLGDMKAGFFKDMLEIEKQPSEKPYLLNFCYDDIIVDDNEAVLKIYLNTFGKTNFMYILKIWYI